MPVQTSREGFTNRLQPEAIFGKHQADYIKFTVGHRIGTFLKGSLIHDLNFTGSNNYFAVGEDDNTQLRLTGQITASSHISSSGGITAAALNLDDSTNFFGGKRFITSGGVGGIYEFRDGSVNVSTGHITASGDISSSATITGNVGTFTTLTNVNTTDIIASGNISASGTSLISGQDLTLTRQLTTPIILNVNTTHVTASGNISASGDVNASNVNVGNRIYFVSGLTNNSIGGLNPNELNFAGTDPVVFQPHVKLYSHLTASGNISASDDIIANAFKLGAKNFSVHHSGTNTMRIGDNTANTVGLLLMGHITASGNISASGTIQSTGNITTNGEFIGTINGGSF